MVCGSWKAVQKAAGELWTEAWEGLKKRKKHDLYTANSIISHLYEEWSLLTEANGNKKMDMWESHSDWLCLHPSS